MEFKEKRRPAVQREYQSVRDGKIEKAIIGSMAEKEGELWPSALQYTICSTAISMNTPSYTVCLQTSLLCNCSDIYICTWSLSASFHYLEPDLERGGLDWVLDDRNEHGTKCTWKGYFESKPSSASSDRVTHKVSTVCSQGQPDNTAHVWIPSQTHRCILIWMITVQPKKSWGTYIFTEYWIFMCH